MGFQNKLEKALTKFGDNNSPTLVAMGVATAKGIFRPTFTMMDKKEDYDTKRYTALREGLTELIAIPVYYLSGVASKFIAKKLASPKNFMSKDVFEKSKDANCSQEVKIALEQAKKLASENLPKIQTSAAFIGVCMSALFIIPWVCSITIKPIMKKLEKQKNVKKTKPEVKNLTFDKKNIYNKVKVYDLNQNYNSGMKVGAL